MFTSFAAAAVRTAYVNHDYNHARQLIAAYAPAGMVTMQQADKHNGGVAMLEVDGEVVGQASRLLVGPAAEWAVTQHIK